MNTGADKKQENYKLKEPRPPGMGDKRGSGGGRGGEKSRIGYDLVEQMSYLYVRVVKARDLPPGPLSGSCDPYAEIRMGNYRGKTKFFEKKTNPKWNQVFAISKTRIQSSVLELLVRDKHMIGLDEYLGKVTFDMHEVPTRLPPNSPLAPQWYRLENLRGEPNTRGEIMAAVWMGTQADEAFPEAWHSDSAAVHGEGVLNVRSKVYLSPKLWYVRVNIIEVQDIAHGDKTTPLKVFVKSQIGKQVVKTKVSETKPTVTNHFWNEDLLFVAAEPFEEHLTITVENKTGPSKDELLGRIDLPLNLFEKRLDHRPVHSHWFDLERFGFGFLEGDKRNSNKFATRIHLRLCLEGGYHVIDESTIYSSDHRPTARQLWRNPIGVLELGILGAQGLPLMKKKQPESGGSTDAYCVAKYADKWVRTRTIVNTQSPKWNEQYTWDVYDPCTVLTLAVIDNCHLHRQEDEEDSLNTTKPDSRIGRIRIRLSTLETDKIYTDSHPLVTVHQSGVKNMGQVELSVRFRCTSMAGMMQLYLNPLLPRMHYMQPMVVGEVDRLRKECVSIIVGRLGRAEPALRKEVVEYILEVETHLWSMRKSRANLGRVVSFLSGAAAVCKWGEEVRQWKNPGATIMVHVLLVIVVAYPELVAPTGLVYMVGVGVWRYRRRGEGRKGEEGREGVREEEVDEEMDSYPTSRGADVVRMRYDRLRSVGGKLQRVVGEVATQGERVEALLSWRDPRATALFTAVCLGGAVVMYVTPVRVMVLVFGVYLLRHPRFRGRMPCSILSFFKRLPPRYHYHLF